MYESTHSDLCAADSVPEWVYVMVNLNNLEVSSDLQIPILNRQPIFGHFEGYFRSF